LRPLPAPDLGGRASPLYVTQADQLDPLCPDHAQSYSIWVNNVGMDVVTNVSVFDVLPAGCTPILERSTPGASYDGERTVTWDIPELAPGEAAQFELVIEVPSWLDRGGWLTNSVRVKSDQVEQIETTEQSLLSECAWLKATRTAQARQIPTLRPSHTPTATHTPQPVEGKPTLRPNPTAPTISLGSESVKTGLDLLTVLVSVALGVVAVVTGILVYRRVTKRA
jgi:hypothetical protein